ncbi:MAG: glutamate 5-kinase [Armatimonadota bacterium]|nr:glutamate 5-kinase [Armatimonadota bacterium]MDR7439672.1 glutamate 5-kinase [Armatimonadota bacterium]MDR7562245.1 glutamate 5-kinase [Armatimonadota bacterium]MDR7567820.1 glutamate 5-kinase [Armatimonadota bacterium]MDR7602143.1 glutamate 5-kinase [Armatimonadota bacterium]
MDVRHASFDPAACRRIVVKVGSALIADPASSTIPRLAGELAELRRGGREVVVVSSGAVALGTARLKLPARPLSIPAKQAAAAVGQPLLMQAWAEAFARHGLVAAQVLLTAFDLADRSRFLNARHTVETLLRWGAVPVVNENDTVAVEELKFGDNDHLSVLLATLVGADLLLVLSDVEALYDRDPRTCPDARPIRRVDRVDRELLARAGAEPGEVGTGGMRSKLLAAEKALAAGIPMWLLPGHSPHAIREALSGAPVGTLFWSARRRYSGRKLWLYQLPRPAGELLLDAGAARALREEGASLLPAGIRGVRGEFGVGDPVRCLDPEGRLVGVGLVNYSSSEIERIKGAHTREIETRLGYKHSDEVIHRDHFVLAGELEAEASYAGGVR